MEIIVEEIRSIITNNSIIFGLYDEKVYKTDKFGSVELKNIKGEIKFKNVEYAYSEIEEIETKDKRKTKKEIKHVKKEPIFKDLSFTSS